MAEDPSLAELDERYNRLKDWLRLRAEQGADCGSLRQAVLSAMAEWTGKAGGLPVDADLLRREPSDLAGIRRLRPAGPRRLPLTLTDEEIGDRLLGAWLGRCAGCALGAPVEGLTRDQIRWFAGKIGQAYPLEDYWPAIAGERDPERDHYGEPFGNFRRDRLDHMPPDDDLAYTVLGLHLLEEYGEAFTTADVVREWLDHLQERYIYTAERVTFRNLGKGLRPPAAAREDNPYSEFIGADIRCDIYGYACPGRPEKAAGLAFRDAILSHERNGVYGAMFFAAVLAAAFVEKDPARLLAIGLSEIPAECRLALAVRQAMAWARGREAWESVWARIDAAFRGMSMAHTINNAAFTAMSLILAAGDFARAISLAVMSGNDVDCTGATAGSIMGLALGAAALPAKWYRPFHDRISTFVRGFEKGEISDYARRTAAVARRIMAAGC